MDKRKCRKKREHIFKFRLSTEEKTALEKAASNYRSKIAFIRAAIRQYNDDAARHKYETMDALFKLLRKYEANFAHIGANLNQCTHKVNELGLKEQLSSQNFAETIAPSISSLSALIDEFAIELREIYEKSL